MDDVNALFDFSSNSTFKRTVVSGGYTSGRMVIDPNLFPEKVNRKTEGTEYAAKYQKAEQEQLSKAFREIHLPDSSGSDLNKLEDIKPFSRIYKAPESNGATEDDEVFDKYVFNYIPPNLPIVSSRSAIMEAIRNNPVVVLQGDTGCGKSTQVPQFILDEAFSRRERCNVIVTQPRRIAARSIAARVCSEQKWELGTVVGYQVGLKTVSSDDTRILFCTTGVLLEKLIRSKRMSEYTHIILDEVHERDQDMDFLFIVVRRLLATNSQHVKIILMSATIDADRFADHFRIPRGDGPPVRAPIVHVEAKRLFDVSVYYLCQLARLKIDSEVVLEEPGIDHNMYMAVQKLCIIADRLDGQDQFDVTPAERTRPTILVFLPGILEIDTMFKMINETAQMHKYHVFALHSSITFEEQQRVFRPAVRGVRNIILATNIAESSVTIPDVKYVIDFCLTKNLCTDTATNLTTLRLEWASHNNCVQRAGRAGRVMHGRVYRLVPQVFYENMMLPNSKPEMLRSPLEQVVLKSKLLDMGPPHAILALAMDQPKLTDIKNTVLVLKELGGLFRTCNDVLSEHDGDLTFIGRVMAGLPIDTRVTRMILFGYCFSVLEECIIIGAGLNVKSIFSSPFQESIKTYMLKLYWSDGSGSDLFAIYKAYMTWKSLHHNRNFKSDSHEMSWGLRVGLNIKSLKEMANLVGELTARLERLGISEFSGVHRVNWNKSEKSVIIKCVISGAFYPNYFMRSPHNERTDRDAFQDVGGRDPETTVFFSNFNHKYIGQLYTLEIKRFFKQCDIPKEDIRVSFDDTNEKIFVTFKRNKIDEMKEVVPGKVVTEVYKAVKMRKCQYKLELRVMHPEPAAELAEHHGLGMMEMGTWVPKRKYLRNAEMMTLPRPLVNEVEGSITYIESPSRFWFRSKEEQAMMANIFNELNNYGSDIEPFADPTDVKNGQILAACLNGDYHRAKIICSTKSEAGVLYKCNFIDFGYDSDVEFDKLRRFRGVSAQFTDIPPRVFECRLAEVQPSSLNSERCTWTIEANRFFEGLVTGIVVLARVYSVVNRVANVIVHAKSVNVNTALINEGLAQKGEENYMSKMDYTFRTKHQNMPRENSSNWLDDQMIEQLGLADDDGELEAIQPSITQCPIRLQLTGPFSPLEAKIFGAIAASASKSVLIEPSSVNSVLLSSCTDDTVETLLVAVTMTSSDRGGQLTARETTLMPNIPGFAQLMALIFCPYMEMQQDSNRSRYVSMLCGLGASPTENRPMFEEHDLQLDLNVDISTEDLEDVNQLRFAIDSLLYTKPGEQYPTVTDMQAKTNTHKIKKLIIKLLENKDRLLMGLNQHQRHTWGATPPELLIQPKRVYGNRAIFPLHAGLTMTSETAPERIAHVTACKINCDKMHSHAKSEISLIRPIMCKLCEIECDSTPAIKMHLLSRLHLSREQQIDYKPQL